MTTANNGFVKHQTQLKAGDRAPRFEGKDQHGNVISSSSFSGKSVILYFYPKDDTEACTATACSLRDDQQQLTTKKFAVVGVSADSERSHAKFASKYKLPFSLLADEDKTIIHAYDVWGQKKLFGKIYDGIVRTTFLINPDGIIGRVIHDVDTKHHGQQILDLEETLVIPRKKK